MPKAAVVKACPLQARYGALWIWMGDAAKADAAQIPGSSDIAPGEGWPVVRGHLDVQGHCELITDNLLDRSQVPYLHPFLSFSGEPPEGFSFTGGMDVESDAVWALNSWVKRAQAPNMTMPWDKPPASGDMWADMRWHASAKLLLDDPGIDKALAYGIDEVFRTQDEVFVSACQQRMGTTDLISLKPVRLPGDAAAVRARRMRAARLAEESTIGVMPRGS